MSLNNNTTNVTCGTESANTSEILDNVDCASLALQVAPVSYYCLKMFIGLRPKLGNTYYHI
jgi:hypothetical protein